MEQLAETPGSLARGGSDTDSSEDLAALWKSLRWWPALAGVAFALFVAIDLSQRGEHGNDLAPVAAASGFVYLTAAAVGKPASSWLAFLLTILINTAVKLGGIQISATWILISLAGVTALYGLVRPAVSTFRRQLLAMIVLGCIAVGALYVNRVAGAYLVTAALLAHAGWDAFHYRANQTVTRSMAEFCLVLDTLLAAFIVVLTAWR